MAFSLCALFQNKTQKKSEAKQALDKRLEEIPEGKLVSWDEFNTLREQKTGPIYPDEILNIQKIGNLLMQRIQNGAIQAFHDPEHTKDIRQSVKERLESGIPLRKIFTNPSVPAERGTKISIESCVYPHGLYLSARDIAKAMQDSGLPDIEPKSVGFPGGFFERDVTDMYEPAISALECCTNIAKPLEKYDLNKNIQEIVEQLDQEKAARPASGGWMMS